MSSGINYYDANTDTTSSIDMSYAVNIASNAQTYEEYETTLSRMSCTKDADASTL